MKFILALLLLSSVQIHASGVLACDNYGNQCILNNPACNLLIPPIKYMKDCNKNTQIKVNIPNGSYCNNLDSLQGWSFKQTLTQSETLQISVNRINSHAGVPNPNIKFLIFWSSRPGVFYIREQQLNNSSAFKNYGPFEWISNYAFKDRFNIYTFGQCNLNLR